MYFRTDYYHIAITTTSQLQHHCLRRTRNFSFSLQPVETVSMTYNKGFSRIELTESKAKPHIIKSSGIHKVIYEKQNSVKIIFW